MHAEDDQDALVGEQLQARELVLGGCAVLHDLGFVASEDNHAVNVLGVPDTHAPVHNILSPERNCLPSEIDGSFELVDLIVWALTLNAAFDISELTCILE